MSKLRRWMPSILLLLVVWLGVSLAVRLIASGKPTAAATLGLLDTKPSVAAGAEPRHAWIASLATRLSRLDLDSRHLVLMDTRFRSAFSEMSPEEQTTFLKTIEVPGFGEFIEGSKTWSPGRYERLMPPALADLEELKVGSTARFEALFADREQLAIRKTGIEGFFKGTDPVTRFDSRPLIERVQKYSQMGR